ncbi:MAG: multidrug efflux SMR transporter [Thermoplasmatales archaeon]|nr:multidrug efflux SMR transporter [Thermoplasmatales archaeon]
MDDVDRLWAWLFVAGLCEIVWAVALGYTNGLERPAYYVPVVVFLGISIYLLSKTMSEGLPTGTAYAVWVGIGAVGTMAVSIALGNEPATVPKLLFVGMIVAGIIGLQTSSRREARD